VNRHTPNSQRLFESAQHQGGFFTARQARDAGFGDNVHSYHVRSGNWIREHRGVYRLAQFPLPARPDLMIWQLWSRNRQDQPQGVFSHATALTLHELSKGKLVELPPIKHAGHSGEHVTFTVYDRGGFDTLDFSGYSQDATININPESFSSVGGDNNNVSIAQRNSARAPGRDFRIMSDD
jgi:hypothetical protein